MSCKRGGRGFVLTCDDCGGQVGLAVDFAVEGFPLAARKGWTCARKDWCPACSRKRAAAAKPAARGAGATPKRRAASSSKR